MMTERKQANIKSLALLFCAIALLMMIWIGIASLPTVHAESTSYTNVLDDLRKDKDFSPNNYPTIANDYSLQVVQVAESTGGELFVYVYQPSGQAKGLRASSINIALVPRESISNVRNYKLTLLNSSGVFYKYRVDGVKVSTEKTRYYTITSIYRPFDAAIDTGTGHGNEITEVDYKVAKEYCFSIINGEPFCRVLDVETIEITDKFVGFVRYKDGFHLYVGACDSHFVAFNTDRPIDRLFEADVYYTSQKYSYSFAVGVGETEKFDPKQDNYAYLDYTQKVEHTGGGLFAPTYKWNRIETVEQFVAENNTFQNVYSGAVLDVSVANKITDEGIAALKGKKWVLRFAETSYELGGAGSTTWSRSTCVGDVTILRLKFETDGITYNLGTIDNKQTGSDKPINEEEYEVNLSDTAKKIMFIVLLILALIIVIPLLPYIVKVVVWVIMLPFRLIAGFVKLVTKPQKNRKKRG